MIGDFGIEISIHQNAYFRKMKLIMCCFALLLLFIGVDLFAQDSNKVICSIGQMPEFPGGEEALYSYLSENITYPSQAHDSAINGVVYVEFVVCKDGELCEVKTKNDIGGGCGNEAVRAVRQMPNWKPGLFEGKPVRVHFTLPISFSMTEKEKKKALRKLKRKR